MATLTTQTTWHGNPRGTVVYADTAYVNSVTSPYIHIPSGGAASTVPTYVSRQGPAPMVLAAAAPVTGGLPQTTDPFFNSIVVTPTGVWAKGTTLTMTATSTDGSETDTLVITIPQNTTQDTIRTLIVTLIQNSNTQFSVFDAGSSILIARRGFTSGSSTNSIFTAVTITTP
jgi:hypothetical protein